jgi:endoglucanase
MEILKKLIELPGVAGAEYSVRELIAKEIKPYVDEIRIDKIGNLIARKGNGKPKVMLIAHMDQIGFMVKHIGEKGFIRFEQVGGWDEKIIPGIKVNVWGKKGPVPGVIGIKPIHIQEKEEQKQPIKFEEMYIDIGASSAKEVEQAGVEIGSFVSIASQLTKLVGTRITGSGFDNKIGCAILIEIVKRLKNFKGTLYAVGSVQEEIGLVGVRGSVFDINPDVILGIDTTIAGDSPQIKIEELPIHLGKGPVLIIKDAISIINPQVRKWIEETARNLKINLQYEVTKSGATDSSITPTIREGKPAGSICIATRYIHTPVEVTDTKDIEDAIKLVIGALGTVDKYF